MFEIGTDYFRSNLLDFVGSKQARSGIIWGNAEPGCVIVTSGGKHSASAGYQDERNPDESWYYFGQGGTGDQSASKKANKLLIDAERTVLLFSTREPSAREAQEAGSHSKRYRFEGAFAVVNWEWYIAPAGLRTGDRLLRFHLIPVSLNDVPVDVSVVETMNTLDLHELRGNVLARNESPKVRVAAPREYRRGSTEIRAYARLRAGGICERCGKPAPFADAFGFMFLEVHHIHRLADDGPDTPLNVAAICPNCHREAHYGSNREQLRIELIDRVKRTEHDLDAKTSRSS